MAYSKQTWVRGEKVASVKLNHMEDGIYENSVTLENGIEAAVDNWLDEHPEATTTVQDGSLTEAKFSNALKLKSIKDYVTPQMFGAKGDGVTDDTEAFVQLNGKYAFIPEGTYIVSHVEYGSKTFLFGSGMGKTIIKQKSGSTTDLIDFADADCSGMRDITVEGYSSTSNITDVYTALVKIRTTRYEHSRYANYCVYEHICIKNAPATGLVLLGRSSADPNHSNSNWNWVHQFNDIRIENCHLWCMIDETSDNRFSNFYINEGNLGNLLCKCSSNMYVNFKLDQPYGAGGGGSLSGFNDGALLLLYGCFNLRFLNLDLQSAYYVGAKIYNSHQINIDGALNNCGIGANGEGIGLLFERSSYSTVNMAFYGGTTPQKYNVKINTSCYALSIFANEYYKTENPNSNQGSCFIVDPYKFAMNYAMKFEKSHSIDNVLPDPSCENANAWVTPYPAMRTVDDTGKVVGDYSIKITGDRTKTFMMYQNVNGLNPNDYYMFLAVVNVEELPTEYANASLKTPYIVLFDGETDNIVYDEKSITEASTGLHLVAKICKTNDSGTMQTRILNYQNNGVFYIGNPALFCLSDLGISYPNENAVYLAIYNAFDAVKTQVFESISVNHDYTDIMGMIKMLIENQSNN